MHSKLVSIRFANSHSRTNVNVNSCNTLFVTFPLFGSVVYKEVGVKRHEMVVEDRFNPFCKFTQRDKCEITP